MNELYAFFIENILRFDDVSFSNDLYLESVYSSVGIVTILVALALTLIYYIFIDSPRFAYWYWWVLVLVINCLLVFVFTFYFVLDKFGIIFKGNDPYATSSYLGFALHNTMASIIIFLLFTFVVKFFSKSCKKIPI